MDFAVEFTSKTPTNVDVTELTCKVTTPDKRIGRQHKSITGQVTLAQVVEEFPEMLARAFAELA